METAEPGLLFNIENKDSRKMLSKGLLVGRAGSSFLVFEGPHLFLPPPFSLSPSFSPPSSPLFLFWCVDIIV